MLTATLLACLLGLTAADEGPVSARAAFDRLKGLAGTWDAAVDAAPGAPQRVTYRLTAAGTAVVETLFAGTDHEMMTVYHLDGDDLRLTHYCAGGNQPRLKLDRDASTADSLVLAFDGGTNFDPARDPHMHEGTITLKPDGSVVAKWTGHAAGKPTGAHTFVLTRASK